MISYRLAKAAFTALDGKGGRLFGGGWNSPGRPMIYTAASPSLALLEVLVHLDLPPDLLPSDYRLLTIDIPDEAPSVRLDQAPSETEARTAGDAFLQEGAALTLSVPSMIVPQERNTLINPIAPRASEVRLLANEPFAFDPRLF